MKSRINRDEREISISELWWYVISKWKWLVIGMVVGALLMGAFGAYKAYSANNAEAPKEITMEDLPEEEQEEVKETVDKYNEYQKENEKFNNSYLRNVNYSNINKGVVTYYIDTNYSYNYLEVEKDYSVELVALYKTCILSETVNEQIMSLKIEGLDQVDISYLINASNEGDVLKISVQAEGDDCRKIMQEVCTAVEEYYDYANEIVGEHSLIKTGEAYTVVYSETIKNARALKNSYIESLYNLYVWSEEALTNEQKNICQKLINGEGVEKVIDNSDERQISFNGKYVAIGMAIGLCVSVVIFIGYYILSKKILSVRTVKEIFDIEIIGSVVGDEVSKSKVLKKLHRINSACSEMEQKKYISETIINLCQQKGINKLALVSTEKNINGETSDIINDINKMGIQCEWIDGFTTSSEMLSKVVQSGNVVLFEKINKSVISEVENYLETVERLSINVLGIVLFI